MPLRRLLAFLALAFVSAFARAAAPTDRPNIVFIADDLGRAVAFHGGRELTPNLDFAALGEADGDAAVKG